MSDTQPAVDISIHFVDCLMKNGDFDALDGVLKWLQPQNYPTDVSLAILSTTAMEADRLPSRAQCVGRFIAAFPDHDELYKFI